MVETQQFLAKQLSLPREDTRVLVLSVLYLVLQKHLLHLQTICSLYSILLVLFPTAQRNLLLDSGSLFDFLDLQKHLQECGRKRSTVYIKWCGTNQIKSELQGSRSSRYRWWTCYRESHSCTSRNRKSIQVHRSRREKSIFLQ